MKKVNHPLGDTLTWKYFYNPARGFAFQACTQQRAHHAAKWSEALCGSHQNIEG